MLPIHQDKPKDAPAQNPNSRASVAERAFHPDEVERSDDTLKVDVEWCVRVCVCVITCVCDYVCV
jgi:hypothetical protein